MIPVPQGYDVEPGRASIAARLDQDADGGWLDAADCVDLLRGVGVPVVDTRRVHDAAGAAAAAAEIGFPVVLKVGSPKFVHKTDVGGVALGLDSAAAVEAAFDGDARAGWATRWTAPSCSAWPGPDSK